MCGDETKQCERPRTNKRDSAGVGETRSAVSCVRIRFLLNIGLFAGQFSCFYYSFRPAD